VEHRASAARSEAMRDDALVVYVYHTTASYPISAIDSVVITVTTK